METMAVVRTIPVDTPSDEWLESLDPGNFNFPNVIWHLKPTEEIILKTAVFAPIVIGGVILNLIILVTLLKNKWLWSPSNFLVANLALVDLASLVLCPWMILVNDFHQSYVLGSVGCRLEGFTHGTMLLGSVGAVMLVSYDRLAAAALPAEARVTKTAAPKLVALTWLTAVGLSLPLALYREYMERQWLDFLEIYCSENIKILPVYWHVLIIALVWIPLGGMGITYGTILWRLERCARQMRSRGGGTCVVRARGRAMRAAACVLLAALLCRLPFTALVYWRNDMLKKAQLNGVAGSFQVLWFVSHYLMYASGAINPLIYGFTNERYRRAMDRTPGLTWCRFGSWCCVCSCKNQAPANEQNSVKVFVLSDTPRPKNKLSQLLKNVLINADHHTYTLPRTDKTEIKSSKVLPLN